jgi:hypothetical protein
MQTETVLMVTGARAWTDYDKLRNCIRELQVAVAAEYRGENINWVLVHGGAAGADNLAGCAGRELGFKVQACPVTSEQWRTLGKKAGVLHSQYMIDNYKPHYALAFVRGESRGTHDCIRRLNQYSQRIDRRMRRPVKIIVQED